MYVVFCLAPGVRQRLIGIVDIRSTRERHMPISSVCNRLFPRAQNTHRIVLAAADVRSL